MSQTQKPKPDISAVVKETSQIQKLGPETIDTVESVCKVQEDVSTLQSAIPSENREESNSQLREAEDEIVLIFVNSMIGHLVQSWEKLGESSKPAGDQKFSPDVKPRRKSLRKEVTDSSSDIKIQEVKKEEKISNETPQLTQNADNQHDESKHGKHRKSRRLTKLALVVDKIVEEPETNEDLAEENTSPQKSNHSIQEQEWRIVVEDEEAIIKLKNGNTYDGNISQKMMHGDGLFIWSDGSSYEGDFKDGQITGKGYFEWPDLSWYEGEVCLGYRHGTGSYHSTFAPVVYTGQWFMGQRHGKGILYYNGNECDYYDGDWLNNKRNGKGFRSYPSGAYYYGEWKNNKQHGRGTMVWPNNDLYQGNWENGQMTGYGEYTWSTFFNNNFAVPAQNMYCGDWKEGKRHGNGLLKFTAGGHCRGKWENGIKNGPGTMLFPDGGMITEDPLFINNSLVKIERPATDLPPHCRCVSETLLTVDSDRTSKSSSHQPEVKPQKKAGGKLNKRTQENDPKNEQAVLECEQSNKSLNGNNVMVVDLTYHLSRWVKLKLPCTSCNFESDEPCETDVVLGPELSDICLGSEKCSEAYIKLKADVEQERKCLNNALLYHLPYLREVYVRYASICCEESVTFEPVLIRMMLWQLLRDCEIHSKYISLVSLDIVFAENPSCFLETQHYPFEQINMVQFLQILLDLSWCLYSSKEIEDSKCTLGSGFHKLIENDIKPNAYKFNGQVLFKYRDTLPLESVFLLYRGLGGTMTVRHLLNHVCNKDYEGSYWFSVRRSETMEKIYHPHILNGKNVFCNGKTFYMPSDKPLNYSPYILIQRDKSTDQADSELKHLFGNITADAAVNCMITICPQIASSEGLICNMEYQLTFLEFYEILIILHQEQNKGERISINERCEHSSLLMEQEPV